MSGIVVREEILKSWDFAIENDMSEPVIRLYISGEADIDIWELAVWWIGLTVGWLVLGNRKQQV